MRDNVSEVQGADRCEDLYNRVKKGQYALKHNKDNEEYEFDKCHKECTAKPRINVFIDESECVWRHEAKLEVKGTENFQKRMKDGRKQMQIENAAKNSRFGVVSVNKKGEKVLKRGEHGQMSVQLSDHGVSSKFKSSFGDLPPVPKKNYVPTGSYRSRKPLSYFETLKRGSNPSHAKPQSQLADDAELIEESAREQPNQAANQSEEEDEREPKLYVDVNVANFGLQRIIVYEGDTVDSLVADFVKRCPIDEFMVEKLKTLLQQQIDGVLERIDEDEDLDDEDERQRKSSPSTREEEEEEDLEGEEAAEAGNPTEIEVQDQEYD